jgi:hypothetical protein
LVGNFGVRVYEKRICTVYKTDDELRDMKMGEEEAKKPRTRLTNQLGFTMNRDGYVIPEPLTEP